MKENNRGRIALAAFFWALAAGLVIMMFVLSGQTGDESRALSSGLTQWFLDTFSFLEIGADELEHILRKTAHFCMFAAEGFLLYYALRFTLNSRKKAVFITAAASALLAVANELHQMLDPVRSCELRDMLIDFGGALSGMLAAVLIALLIRRLRRR